MRWFGESWGAEMNRSIEHTTTPVDEPCGRCHLPIEHGSRGVLLPVASGDGVRRDYSPWHLRCFLSNVLGAAPADRAMHEIASRDAEA